MKKEDYTLKSIRDSINDMGRGSIVFASDFTMAGRPDNVRRSLCLLTNDKLLFRIATGVYCYPKTEGDYFIKYIFPDADTIAKSIAEKTNVRIVPYGDQAAYLVGLTNLQMGKQIYLTDGAPRVIKSTSGRIVFRHTSEMRIFSFINRNLQYLSLAIRAIGKENITDEDRDIAAEIVREIPKAEFNHDIRLCPVWVSDIIVNL